MKYKYSNCPNIATIRIPASMETFETVYFYDGRSISPGPFSSQLQTDVKLYIEDLETWINNLGSNFRMWDSKSRYHVSLYVHDTQVKDLIIPESITKMDDDFYSFDFNSVTLPAGMESITDYAFRYCTKIKYIYSKSRFAPTGTTGLRTEGYTTSGAYADKGLLQAIYVPKGRSENYKKSWTNNADLIFEAPESVSPTGTISFTSLSESIDAHNFVYGSNVPYINLTSAVLDETVTAEALQEVAEKGTIIYLPDGSTGFEGDNIVVDRHATKIVLKDSMEYASPYSFTADEVEYERTFVADPNMAYPLCLPYSLKTLPEGLTAYTLTGTDDEGRLAFTTATSIEANQPYLVKASQEVTNLNTTNDQFLTTPEDLPDGGCEGFGFYGALKGMTGTDAAFDWGAYTLHDDMTWRPVDGTDDNVIIWPMTAFLSPDEDVGILHMTIDGQLVEPLQLGDLNSDRQINISDVTALVNVILGKQAETMTPSGKRLADVNGDGQVTIADVTKLVNKILRKE